jgi:MFS family permease
MGVIVGSFLLIPWLYSPNALLAVMIFTASGFFIQFFYVGNQALMADLTAARERGSVIGIITTLAGFGSIIAPYVGGQLWLQVGPRSPFIISSLLAIAIAVPLILIRKRSHEADCPHCGRAVPQGARFCNLCGQPIVYIKCQACGRILEESASYCDSCGTRQDTTKTTNDD